VRLTSSVAWEGTPTPIVSARTISSGAPPSTRSATEMTWSVATRPSNGQPNEAARVTDTRRPSSWAREVISAAVPIAASTVVPWLRSAKVSVTGKA
jgi:hypothetical protein